MVVALSTNGTLLNKDILFFFKKNNVKMSVSLDGSKKSHDRNKIFLNGKGSFGIISKKIPLVFSVMGRDNASALMSVDPALSGKLFQNLKSLVKLGFRNIHIDPVHGVKWNKQQKKYFLTDFEKIIKFVVGKIGKNNFVYLNPLFSPLNYDILKEDIESEFCPFYKDLEIYPEGEMAFSQFLLNLPQKRMRDKFIIGNVQRNFLNKKYQRCRPRRGEKRRNGCLAGYYRGVRDPKYQGAELVSQSRELLGKMVNEIREKSLMNRLFKNYISQSNRIIRKNLY